MWDVDEDEDGCESYRTQKDNNWDIVIKDGGETLIIDGLRISLDGDNYYEPVYRKSDDLCSHFTKEREALEEELIDEIFEKGLK